MEELKGKNTKELLELCNNLDTNNNNNNKNNDGESKENLPYEIVDNLWGWGKIAKYSNLFIYFTIKNIQFFFLKMTKTWIQRNVKMF
jgi:hypothetical protein